MTFYTADFRLKIKKFQLLLSSNSTEDPFTYRSLERFGGVSIHTSAVRMGTALIPCSAHEQCPSCFSPYASCETKSSTVWQKL